MQALSSRYLLRPVCAGLMATTLGACSFVRPFIEASEQFVPEPKQALVEEPEAPEITVDTAPWNTSVFTVRPLSGRGELPDRAVEKLSVTEGGLYDVIQLLFDGTGMAVTFEGGTDNMRRYGPVTAYNVSGCLTDVMERLGNSIGFFWSVEGKTVNIEAEQQFVIDMPPILNDDNLAGISNTLQYLGARDSYLDRNERRLVFRANRKALRSVEAYISKLRETRSMIVYDAQILQVDLDDSKQMGIQWSSYNKLAQGTTAQSSANALSSGSLANSGLTITLAGNTFRGQALIEFLKTQGTVKNLSKPRIGVMSGTRGSLRVGRTRAYVSKIGSTQNTSIVQTTVELKDLQTGLDLSLFGEEHDRTIYTRINLSITELVSLETRRVLDQELQLPDVADREVKTQVRSRPGDTIILGGLTTTRATNRRSLGIIQLSDQASNAVSELVVVLRPRLVIFRPQDRATQATATQSAPVAANAPLSSPLLAQSAEAAPVLVMDSPHRATESPSTASDVTVSAIGLAPLPTPRTVVEQGDGAGAPSGGDVRVRAQTTRQSLPPVSATFPEMRFTTPLDRFVPGWRL